ncbi:MAG: ribonuclease P protein component [Acidimicrobiales bacterium]
MTGPTVGRIRERQAFQQLRRPEGRGRRGPIRVAFVSSEAQGREPEVQVAYAIGRRCGNAVQRNRLRRRLRAAVREVAGGVRPGKYLVYGSIEVAGLDYREIVKGVDEAMDRASDPGRHR